MQTDGGLLTFNDVSAGDLARMTLDTGGDVGIGTGTTSPAARLEIKDNASNNYSTQLRLSQGYSTSVYSTIGSNFGGAMSINAGQGSTTANLNFNLNGTLQMKIDVSGRVTTPGQPAFAAYGNATGTAYSTTAVILPYNTAVSNIGSHYSTTTYRFTAPVAGTYFFSAAFLNYPTANTNYCTMYITLNGAGYSSANPMSRQQNVSQQTQDVHGTIKMAVNDWVDVRIQTGSGGGAYYTNVGHAHFSGYLVG